MTEFVAVICTESCHTWLWHLSLTYVQQCSTNWPTSLVCWIRKWDLRSKTKWDQNHYNYYCESGHNLLWKTMIFKKQVRWKKLLHWPFWIWSCLVSYLSLGKACHGKHSSLLGQFVSYKGNELLWIVQLTWLRGWGCIDNISVSSKLTNGHNKLEFYITLGWKGLPRTNSLAYLGQFVSYEENELLWIQPQMFKQPETWLRGRGCIHII